MTVKALEKKIAAILSSKYILVIFISLVPTYVIYQGKFGKCIYLHVLTEGVLIHSLISEIKASTTLTALGWHG